MDEPQVEPVLENLDTISPKRNIRRIVLLLGVVLILVVATLGGLAAYGRTYSDRVLSHVRIGDIAFDNMTREQVRSVLNSMNDKMLSTPIKIELLGSSVGSLSIPIETVGETDSYSFFSLDVDKQVEALINLGKVPDLFQSSEAPVNVGKTAHPIVLGWRSLMTHWSVSLEHLIVDENRLSGSLNEAVSPYQTRPQDARVIITSLAPFAYTISPSRSGDVYLHGNEVQIIHEAWSRFRTPNLQLELQHASPQVVEADIEKYASEAYQLVQAPITLSFTDPNTRVEKTWKLSERKLADWITIAPQDTPVVSLSYASTTEYLHEVIGKEIDIPARDAKFAIDANGRVTEFEGSRTGVMLDVGAAYVAITDALAQRASLQSTTSTVIVLNTVATDPEISTGEVNDLGITHLLGVGISNFSGSPSNRIKNIRNAVNKLNGVLIKPGEEFSAIAYTQPYTIEGGYLPEKVIKGDRIIPEIGGGLCQVGTTLFRMAMMSGLEITERRNHSLVVSYYNDLSNGLPGTDATIYDPNPDFRFKNDTNGYVLIQTEMNVNNGELRFSLWGTSDGRRGSYSKPVVHDWFSAGETKIVETTSLPVGVKECQHAYRGANTSFVYTREFADGRKEDKVFESHYRALPQICLVGVESVIPPTDCAEEGCVPAEEKPATEAPVGQEPDFVLDAPAEPVVDSIQ